MSLKQDTKPYKIAKQEVYQAWLKVKKNGGAAGVDGVSVEEFEAKLKGNLYKLWNRLSSGSYYPSAVKRVEIPKPAGGSRNLGVPTVYDRVAQEVLRKRLEKDVEHLFVEDSYGFRAGKSAIDAVRVCRQRCWDFEWVLDVDIEKFFDTIDHRLLIKAVSQHSQNKWVSMYIERCLKAPIKTSEGLIEELGTGTPQGGVISPILSNLYLHYAFDIWVNRSFPKVKFERYADDIVCHCQTKEEAEQLKLALSRRLADCRLKLHPTKSKVVYCKQSNRNTDFGVTSFTFLGYSFQPRSTIVSGRRRIGFLPGASQQAQKRLLDNVRRYKLRSWEMVKIDEIAERINPVLRGWFNYFKHFYPSALYRVAYYVDNILIRWVRNKYRKNLEKSVRWLRRLQRREPELFAHWRYVCTG